MNRLCMGLVCAAVGTATCALGCSSGEPAKQRPAVRTLGANGGELANASASIAIPAGALAEEVELSVVALDQAGVGATLPEGSRLAGDVAGFRPYGMSLLKPCRITLTAASPCNQVVTLDDETDTSWALVVGATCANGKASFDTRVLAIFAPAQDDGADTEGTGGRSAETGGASSDAQATGGRATGGAESAETGGTAVSSGGAESAETGGGGTAGAETNTGGRAPGGQATGGTEPTTGGAPASAGAGGEDGPGTAGSSPSTPGGAGGKPMILPEGGTAGAAGYTGDPNAMGGAGGAGGAEDTGECAPPAWDWSGACATCLPLICCEEMLACDEETDWGCKCLTLCLAQTDATLSSCAATCDAYEWPSDGALVRLSQCWKNATVDIACPCNLNLTKV